MMLASVTGVTGVSNYVRSSCDWCLVAAQNVVLEIKAKLEATRSSVASVPSTNATFAPVQRPETGQFARLPASDEMDSQMSAASYGTADLHNSSNDRTMSP